MLSDPCFYIETHFLVFLSLKLEESTPEFWWPILEKGGTVIKYVFFRKQFIYDSLNAVIIDVDEMFVFSDEDDFSFQIC